MSENNKPKLYNRKELKEIIGCCQATVDRLIRTGELPSIRISPRRVVVSAAALEAWMNGKNIA